MSDQGHRASNTHSMPSVPTPTPETISELVIMYTIFAIDGVEDQTCAICQEKYVSGPRPEFAVRLPACGHAFGLICISTWLDEGSNTCPICRKPILSKEVAAEAFPFEYDSENHFETDEEYPDSDKSDLLNHNAGL